METLAGGALRRLADGIGEVKRMWTAPEHRRRGHARRILEALERRAVAYGYSALRLETATLQSGAIELYRSQGYHPIPLYGRLAVDPRCVCFEKTLVVRTVSPASERARASPLAFGDVHANIRS